MSPLHSSQRRLAVVALFLGAASIVAAAPSSATAGAPTAIRPMFAGTLNFAYTGAPQDWTVPAGITSITARVCGASGENLLLAGVQAIFGGRPGHGGCVSADVRVAPGDVVHVRVGGHATETAGGWPDGGLMTCPGVICGGGGGGSSDIRVGGDTLADRVLVGGGGGGGGGGSLGGHGGNAGGGSGTLGFEGAKGGAGADMLDPALVATMGGGGGGLAQVWNGSCGISGSNGLTPSCAHNVNPNWLFPSGNSGIANQGADSAYAGGFVGGAGGGGYFGGGSGCGYTDFGQTNLGACGGGGGSSYADPSRTANHFLDQGTTQWYLDWLAGIDSRGDNGTVTFSWPGQEVPVTTTTTTTTAAPTTSAAATTTTATAAAAATESTLPPTGSNGGDLQPALALLLLGCGLVMIARRRQVR